MSMYSQTFYGQPSYAAPSFSQPPALSGGYYQPPPPPPPPVYHHVDPVTFRRDYTNRLAELTFNSRPVIQNLSMIAQEYSRFAEIVAQCLEAHIRRVSHYFIARCCSSGLSKWWLRPGGHGGSSLHIRLYLVRILALSKVRLRWLQPDDPAVRCCSAVRCPFFLVLMPFHGSSDSSFLFWTLAC